MVIDDVIMKREKDVDNNIGKGCIIGTVMKVRDNVVEHVDKLCLVKVDELVVEEDFSFRDYYSVVNAEDAI